MSHRFDLRSALLALCVVAVWGTNFVVIKLALGALPPLLFAALRFAAVVVPAMALVRRPDVAWRDLAAYGLLIGVGQFGLLFIAIDGLIAPGLASLLLQVQIVFTLGLVMRGSGERLLPVQFGALALAGAGVVVIAANTGGSTSLAGLGLCLLAAFSWALGNIVQRRAARNGLRGVEILAFVVWSSAFAVPPLVVLALVFEGPARIEEALYAASLATWAAVAWQAIGNTMFGYGVWGWLLARHDASIVAPLSLLVPVFGMGTSALVLGESLPAWKLLAGALILGGLALNLAAPRFKRPPAPAA